ncbi:diversity-generating retroelement protein Avd [bacterium]|nr:diversity-generating retroelement protein Avd [bacterium]
MMKVLIWSFQKVNTFPKSQRFILGQRIENSILQCLELIIKANNTKDKNLKSQLLQDLNTELEVLRSLWRVAVEIRFLSFKSFEFIISKIDEIGKMVGSWKRHTER